jgi:hypothetical protein
VLEVAKNTGATRYDILRAADIFLENGVYIETGPHKHAIQQTFFLYVYEPGGNRVEVATPAPASSLPRLEADRLDRGRAQEGPGLGTENDRVVSHPRHAAGWGVRCEQHTALRDVVDWFQSNPSILPPITGHFDEA